MLVLVTAYLGYHLGLRSAGTMTLDTAHLILLFHLLLGTFLSSSGVSVLNQVMEWKYDRLMDRTKNRPIPSGVISVKNGLILGLSLSVLGVAYLMAFTNLLTGFLSLATILLYTLIYTPSKRFTTLNTLIGSIPGALPPVGGWVAATGSLDTPAWILFGILFCWQMPHFLAIAIMYAADYRKGGFKMIPSVYPNGWQTRYYMLFFTVAMLGMSFGLYLVDIAGRFYAVGSVIAGLAFLAMVIKNLHFRERKNALAVMFSSIIYLPVLLAIIFLDGII